MSNNGSVFLATLFPISTSLFLIVIVGITKGRLQLRCKIQVRCSVSVGLEFFNNLFIHKYEKYKIDFFVHVSWNSLNYWKRVFYFLPKSNQLKEDEHYISYKKPTIGMVNMHVNSCTCTNTLVKENTFYYPSWCSISEETLLVVLDRNSILRKSFGLAANNAGTRTAQKSEDVIKQCV